MLPEGFHWARRWEYDNGDNAVFCTGVCVAYMDRKVDGSWFARLDTHKGELSRWRDCTSRDAGRSGCEAWVRRYADRLRTEARVMAAAWPALRWQGKTGH